jgi:hypothetical protein
MYKDPTARLAQKNLSLGQVQQANISYLESELKKHWNMGKHLLLCWCMDDCGIQVLIVPHYYLGNFTATLSDCSPTDRLDALNGRFIRELISGGRELAVEEFQAAAWRLELIPVKVPLPVPVSVNAHHAIDMLIKRYSISHVESRAVLLFDIVNFSLASPFEQTSQLNSLSYALNSAYSKLLKKDITIRFSLTTTGDGYYVWNQDTSSQGNLDLFYFMLIVVANNAMARRHSKSEGEVVPLLRTGFHIGSHYEFYHAEGENPSLNSYIVGDVTIELARMLDLTKAGQIFIGEFDTIVPTSSRHSAYLIEANTQRFVERVSKNLRCLQGIELSGDPIEFIHCFLTGEAGSSAGQFIRRFRIIDKHGRSRNAYNLRINIHPEKGRPLILGTPDIHLPKQVRVQKKHTLTQVETRTTLNVKSRSTSSMADE